MAARERNRVENEEERDEMRSSSPGYSCSTRISRGFRVGVMLMAMIGCASAYSPPDFSTIPSPPYFKHANDRPQTVFFTVEKTLDNNVQVDDRLLRHTLRCVAEGNPAPSYKWLKNGKNFDPSMFSSSVVRTPAEGTLTFTNLSENDAGEYVCQAFNDNGTAVAAPIKLEQTWIRQFVVTDPVTIKVELGDPYSHQCKPPASMPHARVYWILMGDEPGQFESINQTHISSNDQGTIFFHHVKDTDVRRNRYYTCTAENVELKDYKFGNKFQLDVKQNKRRSLAPPNTIPPTEQYVNQSAPVALQGTTHKLHCFFSGYPAPNPRWMHNGQRLDENNPDNGGFRFEAFGKTLVFNVTMDKQGTYKCEFPHHPDLDRVFVVAVEAAPYWPEGPPPNTNTSEGETVTFNCETSGKPTPTIEFYKNGVLLSSQSNKNAVTSNRYVIEGARLTIYDVRKGVHGAGDNAVYQCKAHNKHGMVWTNFYLNLLAYKPQLLNDPGEVEAVVGQDVTLECKFFGSPNADITWEGATLAGLEHNAIKANAHGVGKLTISKVTPSAEGEFTCIGKNKYGETKGTAHLLVRKATFILPFQAQEEERVAGGTISLPCEAQADDRLDVKYEWRVNGLPLQEVLIENGHYKVGEDNSLTVFSPSQTDTGKYSCIAKTKLDQVEKEIKISIRDVPFPPFSSGVDCEASKQSATVSYEHMEQSDTASPVKEFWVQYRMDSEVDGTVWRTHPTPILPANGKETIEDTNRISKGSFSIALQPFGSYGFRVFARNNVGDSSVVYAKGGCVTPPALPDRNPSEVTAKGAAPENLVVSWRPMQREEWNGNAFHYKIKYKPAEDSSEPWKEVDVNDPFAKKFTINLENEDATPFKEYLVQVQAVNEQGEATVLPESVRGHTGEGVPSAVVTGFAVEDKDVTTATFKWNPINPAGANGNFTGYKIHYWADSEDGTEEEEDYDYEETGEKESLFLRKKRESPSLVMSRTRRADSPDDEAPADGSRKKVVHVSPSQTKATVWDLKPASMNKAYITVANGAHEGPKSETISFMTAEGYPSPVRSLQAYPMNTREGDEKAVVVVKWSRPKHTNGKLTGYALEYCKTSGAKKTGECEKQIVGLKQREIRLAALDFETPYRFLVRATTKAGEGDPSSDDATTLPEITADVTPDTPTLSIGQVGDTAFNVTFVPAQFDTESRRPVGNFYKVQYQQQGDVEWTTVEGNEDSLTVAVEGLLPGTKYQVRVAAHQRDKDGVEQEPGYSNEYTVTTSGRSPLKSKLWLLLLLILILLLLICICCIICVACRHRGQNYPVSEREREQGREPILGKQHFGEYKNEADEKRSLTGSKADSETDSMAEYGDTDPGRFTEDGSFIGQYVPNKTLIAQGEPTKGSTSTFV